MVFESSRLFIATERFDPSDGEKWINYCQWAKKDRKFKLPHYSGLTRASPRHGPGTGFVRLPIRGDMSPTTSAP